jgi:hypothetical protein
VGGGGGYEVFYRCRSKYRLCYISRLTNESVKWDTGGEGIQIGALFREVLQAGSLKSKENEICKYWYHMSYKGSFRKVAS